MRVLFVDEDVGQMSAWRSAVGIVSPQVEIERQRYADRALTVVSAEPKRFDFIIIDLMLAVYESDHEIFTPQATRGFLTAGLVLVERLISDVGVPPERLAIFTQASSDGIFQTADTARTKYKPHFLLWKKSSHLDAFKFGEKVAGILNQLGPLESDGVLEDGAEP